MRWAKAESSRRNTNITVTFTTGASWSYTIQANKADGTKETLRTVNNVDFVNVSVNQTTFGSNDFEIDYIRGTVGDNGSVVFKTSRGNTATVTVSALGRVRICGFGGYPACS
ncbi:hypothetical protein LN244_11015 [Marinobacterium sediminicola]|nr:hypothetical protein LN244_11015 [Marinobacterium sediminicola]